jgi:hypothetical protein
LPRFFLTISGTASLGFFVSWQGERGLTRITANARFGSEVEITKSGQRQVQLFGFVRTIRVCSAMHFLPLRTLLRGPDSGILDKANAPILIVVVISSISSSRTIFGDLSVLLVLLRFSISSKSF